MDIPKSLLERYSRQIILKEVGVEGLKKLRKARVAIVGCGATGSVEAELLARAGIGYIKIIDRDYVDISNLPRTLLFSDDDAEKSLPKAIACANRLGEIVPDLEVKPVVSEVNPRNVLELVGDVDIILDGLDNMETRYLINEVSVKLGIPWIFVGAERWYGMTMTVIPGKTACFKCLLPTPPIGGEDACEVRGVINTATTITATIAVNECIKYLLGMRVGGELFAVDCLNMEVDKFMIKRRKDCPICVEKKFEYLGSGIEYRVRRICGSPAVMIYPVSDEVIDINALNGDELRKYVDVEYMTPFNARLRFGDNRIVVFADGRAIVEGVTDEKLALEIYKKVLNIVKESRE